MRKPLIKRFCLIAYMIFLSLAIISCSSTKKIKYFQDIPDSGHITTITKAEYSDPVIQTGDILNVIVETVDPMSTSSVNAGNQVSGGSTSAGLGGSGVTGILSAIGGGNQSQQPLTGFLVNKDGDIEVPILGKIKAAGYTTFQLKNALYEQAIKYYKTPTIVVRFSNFKVNVTGEVLRPGQYIMADERVTILDAIAMAGDLTVFGKRENVLLLRDNQDGTKSAYRINLKKSNLMASPIYYLRQNDLIYVEPRKAKSDATDAAQLKYVTIASAIISILIIIATRTK